MNRNGLAPGNGSKVVAAPVRAVRTAVAALLVFSLSYSVVTSIESQGSAPGAFFGAPIDGTEVEHYTSTEAMTEAADLVVDATVSAAAVGDPQGPSEDPIPLVAATLEVHEVLSGQPAVAASEQRITVHLLVLHDKEADQVAASIPGTRALFFLRNSNEEVRRLGAHHLLVDNENTYRVVSSQGLWLDTADGVQFPLRHEDDLGFPSEHRGRDYREAREAI
jgi:hypothetical protein